MNNEKRIAHVEYSTGQDATTLQVLNKVDGEMQVEIHLIRQSISKTLKVIIDLASWEVDTVIINQNSLGSVIADMIDDGTEYDVIRYNKVKRCTIQ